MPLILNIDTAIDTASVCLAKDGRVIKLSENRIQKDHSKWLHEAIKAIIQEKELNFSDLEAIAVSIGPGSYTGLRIGLATAKGLCFARRIPLIAIGTLEMMAFAAKEEPCDLLCPMIDARRMEVFAAVFTKDQKILMAPQATIINENSFEQFLKKNKILFFGTGSIKTQAVIHHRNALFKQIVINASSLSILSYNSFKNKIFADLAYTEPLYLKEFFSISRKFFKENS